ncbi:MAG: T9SS type A sorting domain-containing protein [Saprospiraceae bacterium]
MGPFPQLNISTIASSRNDLFGFGLNSYYLFNGQSFIEHGYGGLPYNSSKEFILSENEYLYVISNQYSIYRSTQPLSLQVSTEETETLAMFEIYPNPANDDLSLTISESDLQRIDSYEIIDQVGQVVQQSSDVSNKAINVERLIPGMYNLILKENGMSVGMKKFIRL